MFTYLFWEYYSRPCTKQTLDMAAPLFPTNQVLMVSCIATICKVMCGMAAGATKASITAHFAIRLVLG